MISCFADLVALSPQMYVRPVVVDGGTLTLTQARHPIISMLPSQQIHGSFIPNDCKITEFKNILIITGPNGSGKVINHYILMIH